MHLIAAAFEQRDIEFVLELFDRDAQCRLTYMAAIGGFAEVPGLMQGDDITQLSESHWMKCSRKMKIELRGDYELVTIRPRRFY